MSSPASGRASPNEKARGWRRARDAGFEQDSRKERRIRAAADFCEDTVKYGGLALATREVANHVDDQAWATLYRKWRTLRCTWLAQWAQEILEAKAGIHELIAGNLMSALFRGHRPERTFVHQLTMNIPLPGEEQFVAAAHGCRIVGVFLCVAQALPITECPCFRSIAVQRSKEEVEAFLASTGQRWMSGPGYTDAGRG